MYRFYPGMEHPLACTTVSPCPFHPKFLLKAGTVEGFLNRFFMKHMVAICSSYLPGCRRQQPQGRARGLGAGDMP